MLFRHLSKSVLNNSNQTFFDKMTYKTENIQVKKWGPGVSIVTMS